MTTGTVVAFIVVISIPAFPLLIAWYRILATGTTFDSSRATIAIPLIVTSLSCSLFVLSLVYQPAIGPSYSARRFTIIYANLGANLAMAAVPLVSSSRHRWIVSTSAAAVALGWAYAAVVNAVI